MKNNILIVPDVHGHTKWKKAVQGNSFDHIIFLGDYLDPYFEDMLVCHITNGSSLDNFNDIINFKKANPEKVTLLLGNHDCNYIYGEQVGGNCREDFFHYKEIQSLFRSNKLLFQFAWDITLRKKHYVFSHAGISTLWMDKFFDNWTPDNMVEILNAENIKALESTEPQNTPFGKAIAIAGKYRGTNENYGSPIWIDAELLNESEQIDGVIQIVGHTRCISLYPIFTPHVIYTDCCGEVFKMNDYGTFRTMADKVCKNLHQNPFDPYENTDRKRTIELDDFYRPYCRKCGSRDIFVRAGTMVDSYVCKNCGAQEFM